MSNDWSHLPNAKHIDRILAHVKRNPGVWATTSLDTAFTDISVRESWTNAWNNIKDNKAWSMAWYSAMTGVVPMSACRAVIALIVWDRAGSYMSMDPDKVKMLALIGDSIAILMYPAISTLKEYNHVQ